MGSGSCSITYIISKLYFIMCIRSRQCSKNNVDPEVPHMFGKKTFVLLRAGETRAGGVAFPLKDLGHVVSMALA